MIIANGTVVAVVDGAHLRLFRNVGHEGEVVLADEPLPELKTSSAGSGSRHRSSTANPDQTRLHEDDFVSAVAAYLNRQIVAGRISRLVIVADARTLGELRLHLNEAFLRNMVTQLPKEMARQPLATIQDMLRDA
jgi:protein required for attachment to host cells